MKNAMGIARTAQMIVTAIATPTVRTVTLKYALSVKTSMKLDNVNSRTTLLVKVSIRQILVMNSAASEPI
jgi:hypothetical protein